MKRFDVDHFQRMWDGNDKKSVFRDISFDVGFWPSGIMLRLPRNAKKALYDSPGKMFMIFHDVVSENEKIVILSAPKRK